MATNGSAQESIAHTEVVAGQNFLVGLSLLHSPGKLQPILAPELYDLPHPETNKQSHGILLTRYSSQLLLEGLVEVLEACPSVESDQLVASMRERQSAITEEVEIVLEGLYTAAEQKRLTRVDKIVPPAISIFRPQPFRINKNYYRFHHDRSQLRPKDLIRPLSVPEWLSASDALDMTLGELGAKVELKTKSKRIPRH
jgi:hypothetical protein